MGRKRKELPLLSGVEICGVAAEGKSIARVDDLVVFVPFGAPGDIADIKLDKKKHSYAEGHIERLVIPSSIRVEPRCEHFTTCGGCRWQHLPYEEQLRFKQQQVTDALTRIAKIPLPDISPILGSDTIWAYRNKMEYTFSNMKFPLKVVNGVYLINGFIKDKEANWVYRIEGDVDSSNITDDIIQHNRMALINNLRANINPDYLIEIEEKGITLHYSYLNEKGEILYEYIFSANDLK